MNFIFDINVTMLTTMGYSLSYAEFLGTVFGLLTVYWASRANIWTWPAGIVNEVFFFVIFLQVNLYANMLLQVIFFVTTLYGWYSWRTLKKYPEKALAITHLSLKSVSIILLLVAVLSAVLGFFLGKLHILFPIHIQEAAAYPYADATVMVMSVAATLLLARKKVQSWLLWVLNDVICIVLYFLQGIYFIAIEYMVFLGIASWGLYQWSKMAHLMTTGTQKNRQWV